MICAVIMAVLILIVMHAITINFEVCRTRIYSKRNDAIAVIFEKMRMIDINGMACNIVGNVNHHLEKG